MMTAVINGKATDVKICLMPLRWQVQNIFTVMLARDDGRISHRLHAARNSPMVKGN